MQSTILKYVKSNPSPLFLSPSWVFMFALFYSSPHTPGFDLHLRDNRDDVKWFLFL